MISFYKISSSLWWIARSQTSIGSGSGRQFNFSSGSTTLLSSSLYRRPGCVFRLSSVALERSLKAKKFSIGGGWAWEGVERVYTMKQELETKKTMNFCCKMVDTPPPPLRWLVQAKWLFLFVSILQLEVCMPIAATTGVGVEPGGTQGAKPHFSFTRGRAGRNHLIRKLHPPPSPHWDGRAIQPNHIEFRTCSALAPMLTQPSVRN